MKYVYAVIVLVSWMSHAHAMPFWADSYSINGACYCDSSVSNYDHGINNVTVQLNGTSYKVPELCEKIGRGPEGNRIYYNDIQCGNGPANEARDEQICPGVPSDTSNWTGPDCGLKGPRWSLGGATQNTPRPVPESIPDVPVVENSPPEPEEERPVSQNVEEQVQTNTINEVTSNNVDNDISIESPEPEVVATEPEFEPADAPSTEIFISSSGSDNNNGSEASPVASFSRAAEIAKAGDMVYVMGGTYDITSTQTINSNGTQDAVITFKPYKDEEVVLNGANLSGGDAGAALLDITGSNIDISGFMLMDSAGQGIKVMGGENIMIADNIIENSQDTAISIGDESGDNPPKDIFVVRNEVMGTAFNELGGAVGSFAAQNVTFQDNKIYDNLGNGLSLMDVTDAKIIGNDIHDNTEINLMLDNSSMVSVENNKIYSEDSSEDMIYFSARESGSMIEDLMVMNNIIHDANIGMTADRDMLLKDTTFENNIFMASDSVFNIEPPVTGQHNVTFTSNIFAVEEEGEFVNPRTNLNGMKFSGNCWAEPGTIPTQAQGNGDIQTTVSIVNPTLPASMSGNLRATEDQCSEIIVNAGLYEPSAPSDEIERELSESLPEITSTVAVPEDNEVTIPEEVLQTADNSVSEQIDAAEEADIVSEEPQEEPQRIQQIVQFVVQMIESILKSIFQVLFG